MMCSAQGVGRYAFFTERLRGQRGSKVRLATNVVVVVLVGGDGAQSVTFTGPHPHAACRLFSSLLVHVMKTD